jgi:hypothetical protein
VSGGDPLLAVTADAIAGDRRRLLDADSGAVVQEHPLLLDGPIRSTRPRSHRAGRGWRTSSPADRGSPRLYRRDRGGRRSPPRRWPPRDRGPVGSRPRRCGGADSRSRSCRGRAHPCSGRGGAHVHAVDRVRKPAGHMSRRSTLSASLASPDLTGHDPEAAFAMEMPQALRALKRGATPAVEDLPRAGPQRTVEAVGAGAKADPGSLGCVGDRIAGSRSRFEQYIAARAGGGGRPPESGGKPKETQAGDGERGRSPRCRDVAHYPQTHSVARSLTSEPS